MKASDLPNWTFQIKQIAPGVYALHGVDQRGHIVDSIGTDLDLLEEDLLGAAPTIEKKCQQIGGS